MCIRDRNDATVRLLAQKLPEDVELCVLSGMTLADAAACAVIPFGVNTENLRTLTALSALDMRMPVSYTHLIPSSSVLPPRAFIRS